MQNSFQRTPKRHKKYPQILQSAGTVALFKEKDPQGLSASNHMYWGPAIPGLLQR